MDSLQISLPGSLALIQQATWRDLNGVRYLEQVCFPKDAWPLWDIIGVLTLPNVIRLKAVVGRDLVGFIAGDLRPAQNMAWIATVGVLPTFQRQGIGAALLQACEERIVQPRVRLNVRVSNKTAIHLYEGRGYREVGVWPGYYDDGEEALILEKELERAG